MHFALCCSLESTLAEEREKAETMEYNYKCDISDLQVNLTLFKVNLVFTSF